MGRAHVLMTGELLARVAGDPLLNKYVLIVSSQPFCDDTHLALVSSDALPEGYHGQNDFVIENGIIRFKKDQDV